MSITFMCLIVGEGGGGGGGVLGGGKLQILRKKPSSSFGYYRSMTSAPLPPPNTHTHTHTHTHILHIILSMLLQLVNFTQFFWFLFWKSRSNFAGNGLILVFRIFWWFTSTIHKYFCPNTVNGDRFWPKSMQHVFFEQGQIPSYINFQFDIFLTCSDYTYNGAGD